MILYFSGTGNSAHAARRIAAITGDSCLNLFERIRSHDRSPLSSDRPWVIVTPTYAWRIPRIVEALLQDTPLLGSRELYFVLTCGDSIGNAAAHARSFCTRRHLRFMGLEMVVMPENYIAMFNAPGEAEARQIVRKADAVIDAAAVIIASGKPLPERKVSLFGRIMSGPVNSVFYALCIKDRKFTVSDACMHCGLCESLCPADNIRLQGGKPVWQGKCTHCMACICSCPANAIEYGRISVGKPRYRCPEEN